MNDLWLLHRLQQLDHKMASLRHQIDALVPSAEITKAIAVRERKHRDEELKLRTLKTALKDAELKLSSVTAHRSQIEGKLYSGTTTNPKELSGFAREAEQLKAQEASLEEKVLGAMEEIEAFESEHAALAARLAKARQALEKEQGVQATQRTTLESQVSEAAEKREQLTRELDPATLQRYESLRSRKGGVAVAKLQGSACGECGTSLPDPLCRKVRERQIELCTGCERILFQEAPAGTKG